MQIFSNAGQDEPQKIHNDAARYIPADTVPSKLCSFNLAGRGWKRQGKREEC